MAIPGLWADLDIASPAHKANYEAGGVGGAGGGRNLLNHARV